MRIERVNENKIKILLDNDEAQARNITVKAITQNTPEVQQMFWQAIHMAKEYIDFSIEGAKLFVETIPSQEDGVGMLVTKVYNESELSRAVENCSYKGKIRKSELSPENDSVKRQRKYIYKFENFESVCGAAAELSDKYRGHSVLYKMDEKFYLYLVPADSLYLYDADMILSEFAQKQQNGQYLHGRLNEYGALMIEENAIGVLAQYFCKC